MQVATYNTGLQQAPRLEELLQAFINSQDIKNNSRETYSKNLRHFFKWTVDNNYNLSELARPEVIRYKEELLLSNKSSLTVSAYITPVRKFYDWTEANKYYPNIAKSLKSPKRVQQFRKRPLTPEQCTQLLHSTETARDQALISLILRTGLRTIEVIRANVEDITFIGSNRVLMIQGKGRDTKDTFVVLTDKTLKAIDNYLKTRPGAAPQEPLFISTSNNNKGERLTTKTISTTCKKYLRKIGLDSKEFTAHSLRHTTIVNIRRAGGTLEQAQATARHSTPATTQIYDHYFREEERLKNSGEALLDSIF